MCRRSAGGFSLPELFSAMFILGLLSSLVFSAFINGSRFFYETSMRQSAENELRAIKALLERDFDMTNFWHLNVISRATPDGQRDAIALTALSDWSDPQDTVLFDAVAGRPLWDRYVVWYATQENPGRLVRQVVSPGGAPFETPYADLDSEINDANPLANDNVVISRFLSFNVEDFEVTPRLQNGSVRVRVRLRREGGQRGLSAAKAVDTLEVTMTFKPRNTWPAI